MTPAANPSAPIEGQLVAQDTSRVLQRIWTGHVVGTPAMGYGTLMAKVVGAGPITHTVKVTITGFGETSSTRPTSTCYYPTQPTTAVPAAGTACVVTFPSNEPQGVGVVLVFLDIAAISGGAIIGTGSGPPS